MAKRLQSQLFAHRWRHSLARLTEGSDHAVVLIRTCENSDVGVIFRCRTHHGRPTNIDVLNGVLPGHIRSGDSFTEGIKIDDHKINQRDLLLIEVCLVGCVSTIGEKSTMDARMQGLNPSTQKYRCAGVIRDPCYRQSCLLQDGCGASTGKKLVTKPPMQRLCQRHKTGFVRDTQQGERCHGFRATQS